MNTIKFSNGETIEYVSRIMDSDVIQGVSRDILEFRFNPEKVTFDQIDNLFTESNCTRLIVTDSRSEYETVSGVAISDDPNEPLGEDVVEHIYEDEFVYDNYIIRLVISQSHTSTEKYISIRIAQSTVLEGEIVALKEETTNTQIALCDVYEMLLMTGSEI